MLNIKASNIMARMKIVWKSTIKELVGPFFFGLGVITFVLLMDFILDVLKKIINKGLPIDVVLEVFALSLAWMLALSIPMAVLIAALMGYGRLSSDSEIIAYKACGVSLINLMKPGILFGMILAALLMLFNDRILPEANHRARMLMSDITRKKPTWSIEENIFLDYFDGYHILVRKVNNETNELIDVTIFEHKDPKAPKTITAKSGEIKFSPDGSRLILDLYNGEIHEPDPNDTERYRRVNFKKQTMTIEGASNELVRSTKGSRGDREMSVEMMLEYNRKYQRKADSTLAKIDSVVNADMDKLINYNPDQNNYLQPRSLIGRLTEKITQLENIISKIEYEVRNHKTYIRQVNSRNVEIHKKFSIPVACIVFVMIGAPLGVMTRKGGMATSIGLSLFFFIIYWAFLIGGEELADRMYLSGALSMWLPNIIIGIFGIYLTHVVNKRTTVEGMDLIMQLFSRFKK